MVLVGVLGIVEGLEGYLYLSRRQKKKEEEKKKSGKTITTLYWVKKKGLILHIIV